MADASKGTAARCPNCGKEWPAPWCLDCDSATKPPASQATITPGDLNFAAAELLAVAQKFRLMAYSKERRGALVPAAELRRDAERIERVAHRLLDEAKPPVEAEPITDNYGADGSGGVVMADEEQDGGKVIAFRKAPPSSRLKRLEDDEMRLTCRHINVEIWAAEPILECTDCGAVVDPYAWIRTLTREWDAYEKRREDTKREVEREMAELQKRLRILRKEYQDESERCAAEREIAVLPPRKGARS